MRVLGRLAGLVIAAAVAIGGCSGVPDRSATADAITAELRALPGVDTITADYQNGMTVGQSYNVRLTFDPAVTADQVNTVVARYFSRIGGPELDGHTSRLQASIGDSSIAYFSGRSRSDPPLAFFQRWYTLTGALDGPFSWSKASADPLNLIEYQPSDPSLDATLAQLRTVAADLQQDQKWIIRNDQTTLRTTGPFPDARTAALVAGFAATGRRWNVESDPARTPVLTMSVWKSPTQDQESTARADLRSIAGLGVPVGYTLLVSGGPHLEVAVGGCRTDGTKLQQRLNKDFGSC